MTVKIFPQIRLRKSILPRATFVRFKSAPSIKAKWFYNTDVPLSKPEWYDYEPDKEPQKFVPFSDYDNARLEKSYRKASSLDVNEDRLFEVNFESMRMAPIYWPGPEYEVRRGTWFTYDGTPLAKELAKKVEAGYFEVKAFDLDPGEEGLDIGAQLEKPPAEIVTNFNKHMKDNFLTETMKIEEEDDVADVGNDQAVIFFDDTYGALFPKSLSTFQVGSLRNIQPQHRSLMSVVPIRRGYSEGLDSSIIESVKATNVASLSEIILNEVSSLFAKKQTPTLAGEGDEDREKQLEEVMESDFKNDTEEHGSKRDIDHLVLCVHGIGQILGYKYESVNFTHSINVMRSTMKNVYANEKKYHQLAYGEAYDAENETQETNNTIQVLPISWRQQVSFHPRKPFTIKNAAGESSFPSLSDINVDGVRPLRNIVGDVVLDVLLYYEPRYIAEIMKAVVTEMNRVYELYLEKNPDFLGKVHIFGHSLGSAIVFDLLCKQKSNSATDDDFKLNFDVENLFCVGSPVGMFKLLQQKNIRPRCEVTEANKNDVASPKCVNLYNVFHPCDPVSYRMEPLVNPKFAKLKAEEVPFALQGLNTQVQSLSSIGDDILEKVLLSVSWLTGSGSEDEQGKKPSKRRLKKKSSVEDENALGDIISTLTSTRVQSDGDQKGKVVDFDKKDLDELLELNRSGRIDYSLPMGVFSIALVSAISAHVSYFEDEETAGFVMKEILSSDKKPVESRKVTLVK